MHSALSTIILGGVRYLKKFLNQFLRNGFTFLNLLGGGIVGFGIDALTGSMMKYDKKVYDITLSKKQ